MPEILADVIFRVVMAASGLLLYIIALAIFKSAHRAEISWRTLAAAGVGGGATAVLAMAVTGSAEGLPLGAHALLPLGLAAWVAHMMRAQGYTGPRRRSTDFGDLETTRPTT